MFNKNEYKKRLLLLRKWGLAPKIDLRKPITSQNRRFITRRFNEFNEIVTSKKGEFVRRHVSTKTKNKIKKSGFATKGNTVFIPTNGSIVHIKNNKIKREFKSGKTQTLLLIPSNKTIIDLLKSKQNIKLQPGETITVQIGSNAPFSKSIATNYSDLLKYLSIWKPNISENQKDIDFGVKELKNELITNMIIVKIPRS
jgi:hypothetical protein